MRIVVFDPGGTTGYAIFEGTKLVQYGSFPTWQRLEELIVGSDKVLSERITVRSPTFNPIGLEVIGVIKYLSELYGIQWELRQPAFMASARKWRPRIDKIQPVHAADAVAHGVAFLGPTVDLTVGGI